MLEEIALHTLREAFEKAVISHMMVPPAMCCSQWPIFDRWFCSFVHPIYLNSPYASAKVALNFPECSVPPFVPYHKNASTLQRFNASTLRSASRMCPMGCCWVVVWTRPWSPQSCRATVRGGNTRGPQRGLSYTRLASGWRAAGEPKEPQGTPRNPKEPREGQDMAGIWAITPMFLLRKSSTKGKFFIHFLW